MSKFTMKFRPDKDYGDDAYFSKKKSFKNKLKKPKRISDYADERQRKYNQSYAEFRD